ncbi:hypothetical protein Tco_0529889 [Tanacetum coccineum]
MFKTTKYQNPNTKKQFQFRINTVEAISTQNRQNKQGSVNQAPPYQPQQIKPLVNQALPPFTNSSCVKNDFESYAKVNEANMNNLQMKWINFKEPKVIFKELTMILQKKQMIFQKMMLSFMQNYHTNQASSSSSLPSNTIPNPRNEAKAITTRSGASYDGPPIPPPVVEKEPELDKGIRSYHARRTSNPPLVPRSKQRKETNQRAFLLLKRTKPSLPTLQTCKRENPERMFSKLQRLWRNLP